MSSTTYNILTLIIVFLAITIVALPSDAFLAEQLSKPKNQNCEKAGLYICSDVHFRGNCTLHTPCIGSSEGSEATCLQLDGKASSVGPDVGFVCTFYQNALCRDLTDDGVLSVKYPGYDNLCSTKMGDWNDKARSVQCFRG